MAEYNGEPLAGALGPAPDFDVRAYARSAVGNLREGLNLDAFEKHPLRKDTLRLLSFLQAIERSTMQHLRTVLVTPTHKDARITAFLTTWAFEKFWISDALSAVLAAHETVAPSAKGSRLAGAMRELKERFAPIRESMVSNQIGVDVIAVHMSVGAVDGWLTQAAYARISELESNSELASTIDTILNIKARHLSFFEPQSEYRLAASKGARSLTRRRLRATAWPVGAGDLPRADREYFFDKLFRPVPELITTIDEAIDGLPGLRGLGLIERAAGMRAAA